MAEGGEMAGRPGGCFGWRAGAASSKPHATQPFHYPRWGKRGAMVTIYDLIVIAIGVRVGRERWAWREEKADGQRGASAPLRGGNECAGDQHRDRERRDVPRHVAERDQDPPCIHIHYLSKFHVCNDLGP